MDENKIASREGGGVAKKARIALETKTGKKVVTTDNFLSLKEAPKELDKQ